MVSFARVLILKYLPLLDDDSLARLCCECTNLKLLDVSGCSQLTGRAVREIGSHSLKLMVLNIMEITTLRAGDLAPLLNNCASQKLHTLSITQCHLLDGITTEEEHHGNNGALWECRPTINLDQHLPPRTNIFATSSMRSLTSHESTPPNTRSPISISRSPVSHSASASPAFPSTGIEMSLFKYMKCMNFTGCHSLTDESLKRALICAMPSLHSLNISLCHRLTDATLQLLANFTGGLPHLEHLDISGLQLLTDRGISALCRNVPELRSLGLGHCRRLSTDAVQDLVLCCPKLSELKLPFCRNINAYNLITGIINGASSRGDEHPALDFMSLRGCKNEPDDSNAWSALRKRHGWDLPGPGALQRKGFLMRSSPCAPGGFK